MPLGQVGNPLTQLPIIPYLLIFLIFYFLVIRPEKTRKRQHKEMVNNLNKNDQVITTSGIHGTVVLVKEKTVVVRVDDNVKIEFDKEAMAAIEKAKS